MFTITINKPLIRRFGLYLSLFLMILGSLASGNYLVRSTILISLSLTSLSLALIKPLALRPIYIAAMKFAHILGFINTKILLGLCYYGLFTPIGLCLRLFGKDLLRLKPSKQTSYWIDHKQQKEVTQKHYEHQF